MITGMMLMFQEVQQKCAYVQLGTTAFERLFKLRLICHSKDLNTAWTVIISHEMERTGRRGSFDNRNRFKSICVSSKDNWET